VESTKIIKFLQPKSSIGRVKLFSLTCLLVKSIEPGNFPKELSTDENIGGDVVYTDLTFLS